MRCRPERRPVCRARRVSSKSRHAKASHWTRRKTSSEPSRDRATGDQTPEEMSIPRLLQESESTPACVFLAPFFPQQFTGPMPFTRSIVMTVSLPSRDTPQTLSLR